MSYKKLIKGYKHFEKTFFSDKGHQLYKNLIEKGQSPEALIIACSDSRIEPAILTQSRPGDFFAIRNIAALVPPYQNSNTLHGTSSAIEYAVCCLNVKHIIVLGHSQCGGIEALSQYQETQDFEFLSSWLAIADQARKYVAEQCCHLSDPDKIKALEQAAILTSLKNLFSFPWVKEKHQNNDLELHGWYFDMKAEKLLEYKESHNRFESLQTEESGSSLSTSPQLQNFIQNYVQCCPHK